MNRIERQATIGLALIFAIRMLGLFMILPILSLHATDILGATPFLMGVALGIYGLTQAAFQIPLGWLSDKYGRHQILSIGLGLFVAGSLVAAWAPSIYWIIVGRALQGMGAVGAPILALLSELTRESVRTRAMAIIGITIGASFSLAMVLGPILDSQIGLSGIFLGTAFLGALCWIVLYRVPHPIVGAHHAIAAMPASAGLWQFQLSIGCLHAILTALFLALPLRIPVVFDLASNAVWKVYLPVLGLAVLTMGPLLRWAHPAESARRTLAMSVILLILAEGGLLWAPNATLFFIALALFFTVFNLLEACLPSWISRVAPPDKKGAILGVYSTMQFFGIFIGGVMGGGLSQRFGTSGIFIGCIIFSILWGALLVFRPASKV